MRHGRTVDPPVETEQLELLLLGPLEARVGGAPVALGGPKQRALLALLTLHANDVVPLDVLVDQLWDVTPPRTAPAYVQNCVHRLRKGLGAEALETRAPGYRLLIDPEAVDARRFERLVREARGMPTRERAAALRDALAQFERSLQIDPKHSKTLLNVGIVRAFGKQDLDGAARAWQQVLDVAPPDSPEAKAARQALDGVTKAHPDLAKPAAKTSGTPD